jgi:hypothetical protein
VRNRIRTSPRSHTQGHHARHEDRGDQSSAGGDDGDHRDGGEHGVPDRDPGGHLHPLHRLEAGPERPGEGVRPEREREDRHDDDLVPSEPEQDGGGQRHHHHGDVREHLEEQHVPQEALEPVSAARALAHQVVATAEVVEDGDDVDQGRGGHVHAELRVAELAGQVREGEEPADGPHDVRDADDGDVLPDEARIDPPGRRGEDLLVVHGA